MVDVGGRCEGSARLFSSHGYRRLCLASLSLPLSAGWPNVRYLVSSRVLIDENRNYGASFGI